MSKSRFVAVSRAGRRKGQNEHPIANQLIKALARTGVRAFMYSGCARGNSPLCDLLLLGLPASLTSPLPVDSTPRVF
jgi:hypothetical protein